MPLKPSTGNMYPWVTHTHAHLGGECPHRCSYCYVTSPRFGRPAKYSGPLRLIENEFAVRYGAGKTIFVDHCNDIGASAVPLAWIIRIMAHCSTWPENTYVFQTRNPIRFPPRPGAFPPLVMIGTTLESNRPYSDITAAPDPASRVHAMIRLRDLVGTFVTVEPILDFDVTPLLDMIQRIRPAFVNIGADSKGHGLPEPPPDKILALIAGLQAAGIEIREKRNLDRLLGGPEK